MNSKSLLASVVVVMLAITCANFVVDSDVDAIGDGHVTVEIEWNTEYQTLGIDSTNRIKAAEEVVDGNFDSIQAAATAFSSIYQSGDNGNYTGSGTYTDVNGNERTEGYKNANPLYYRASDAVPDVNKMPVSSVVFTVHGNVQAGAESIVLGSGQGFHVSDVVLQGVDDAYVAGKVSLSATVAGGYKETFVYSGEFSVTGIEFENIGSINASGSAFNTDTNDERAESTTVSVRDCVFHNQLYMYTEDPTYTGEIVKNVVGNTFINPEGTTEYAFFLQGVASKLNFSGNTINGFRGINVQEQNRNDMSLRLDAVIDGNTIMNNTNAKGCVQFTAAHSFLFTNNTMIGIEGNAFWTYPSEKGGSVTEIDISNNNIEADYLFYNQQDDVTITSSGNILDIVNPGKCLAFNDDGPIGTISSDVVIEGSPSEPEDTFPPGIWDDDDDYVPPIYVPSDTSSSDDETVKIVACAAAAVVAAIMAAFLILGNKRE